LELKSEVSSLRTTVLQKEQEAATAMKNSTHSLSLLEANVQAMSSALSSLRREKKQLVTEMEASELSLKNTKLELELELTK